MSNELSTGVLSAALFKTLATPFEVIKLRLQCMDQLIRIGVLQTPYRGFFDCLFRIIREEGAMVLWKGNTANVLLGIIPTFVNFFIKLLSKRIFKNKKDKKSLFLNQLLTGAGAGLIIHLLGYPTQLAFTKLSTDVRGEFKDALHAQTSVKVIDGVLGLFPGLLISLTGLITFRGTYAAFHALLRRYSNKSLISEFLLNLCSILAAQWTSYPFDLTKRRMMVAAGTPFKYLNTRQCVETVYKVSGVSAFWNGARTNVFRAVSVSFLLLLNSSLRT